MSKLHYDCINGIVLSVHAGSAEGATDAQLREILAWMTDVRPKGSVLRQIVVAGGGSNAAQRKLMKDTIAKHFQSTKTVVMTASVVTRATVTALQWFMPGLMAAAPDDFEKAFDYLDVRREDRPSIRRRLIELRHAAGAGA